MSLAKAAVDPAHGNWIFIEFAGPGSAIINGIEFSQNIVPTQLMLVADVLDLEGKNAFIDQRNKIASVMASGVSIPKRE
jgi:hypothetical protein